MSATRIEVGARVTSGDQASLAATHPAPLPLHIVNAIERQHRRRALEAEECARTGKYRRP